MTPLQTGMAVFTLTMLGAGRAATPWAQDDASDAAIRTILADQVDAWNAGDGHARWRRQDAADGSVCASAGPMVDRGVSQRGRQGRKIAAPSHHRAVVLASQNEVQDNSTRDTLDPAWGRRIAGSCQCAPLIRLRISAVDCGNVAVVMLAR